MGKKRIIKRAPVKRTEEADREVDDVDMNEEDFYYDEIDKFHSDKERILLDQDSDSDQYYGSEEEEVLGIASEDEHSDSDEDVEQDDENDGAASAKAWGKKKSGFYGVDTLDGLEGSDREEAERDEEKEVLAIQKRLAQQMDEDDFGLDMLQAPKEAGVQSVENDVMKSAIEADFSSLSRKAQWRLVKKQSPELEGLIQDFQVKVKELESELTPLMHLIKCQKIPEGYGADFINLKYRTYLAYILNISFYLALKTTKTPVQNHPVISRLVQYKTVINRLAPLEKKLRPDIEKVLAEFPGEISYPLLNNESENGVLNLNFTQNFDDPKEYKKFSSTRKRKKESQLQCDSWSAMNQNNNVNEAFSNSMNEKLLELEKEDKSDNEEVEAQQDERRAINDEIAKNKGLKQKRRKIDRNPRVKMREKYRKAKIRRRGQVREYKPEIKKYSGEASGIRIGVKKSVTLH